MIVSNHEKGYFSRITMCPFGLEKVDTWTQILVTNSQPRSYALSESGHKVDTNWTHRPEKLREKATPWARTNAPNSQARAKTNPSHPSQQHPERAPPANHITGGAPRKFRTEAERWAGSIVCTVWHGARTKALISKSRGFRMWH